MLRVAQNQVAANVDKYERLVSRASKWTGKSRQDNAMDVRAARRRTPAVRAGPSAAAPAE